MSTERTTAAVWRGICDQLRVAEAAHPVMTGREPAHPADQVDATRRYVVAVDLIFADLLELRRRGALQALRGEASGSGGGLG